MSDRFVHPDLADVPLASVLHALAEPARMRIIQRLDAHDREGGDGLSCSEGACAGMARATMSNHYSVLRASGLVEARKEGVRVLHRLRRDAVDARFPGLLASVIEAAPPLN